ncbi:MAG TPA: VWA domain-containing protein, partial [Thioalkalivibrio sp.]|nr:VWA domain-containing protein [Thioalkalivibrio sp.]
YQGRHLQREASAVIAVSTESNPVQAHPYWAVPDALRGGFNLAWTALGSQFREIQNPRAVLDLEQLFDGMVAREEGLNYSADPSDDANAIVVELGGDGSNEIAGFVFNPLGRRSTMDGVRRFEVALSADGEHFTTVLTDRLEPMPREQYFPLEVPQAARFARLTLIDNFTGRPGSGRMLGEWKVVARPDQNPFPNRRVNLADPELGGHVVRAKPLISQRWDDALLLPDSADVGVRVNPGATLEWVIGFHHNRAAQIDGIEWVDVADPGSRTTLAEVEVAVSLDSPLGPWQPIADWQLDGGTEKRLDFDAPVWARFVRFSTASVDERTTVLVPSVVRILERPADGTYRSILGEWGSDGHRAIFEELHPPEPPLPFVLAEHDRRENAAQVVPGDVVQGRVWLGRHEHWYRLEMPPEQNTLELELQGDPTVRTVLAIENAAGEPIDFRVVERKPDLQRIEAFVGAGEAVFLKLEEPPRNVVFAWDTSASVGAYLPVIYNAMSTYAEGLVPGRDAANLMPFGSGLLLGDWYGEPYLIQKILNEYPREESSSAAEQTLARASQALGERAGAKAIVLITDAATNRHAAVWEVFDQVRPRIMALGLDSTGAFGRYPRREQDLMQDWARVNGHYAHLRSEGEMEVAFDRAAALLREPAPYRLTIGAVFREAPQPGRLRVLSGPEGSAGGLVAGGAVSLILDASGSMLQRMDGVRRIEIAKRGLVDAVSRHLAPGTPVALRVFGHREPNACRTDLEIPLAPLDPAAAQRQIGDIQARNLARTPIADSLAQVESDLSMANGPKTVVLVTDGEETCDGDPGAVIQSLLDKGFDFRLNIIGFALDDETLEAQFAEWSELGGGAYFSAGDADSFGQALQAALQVPYAVYDRQGVEVARGLVDGEPVELPAGSYRVVVAAVSTQQFEDIRIPAETEVELRLD